MIQEELIMKFMEQLAATDTADHAQQLLDVANTETSDQGDLIHAACKCTKDELLRVFTEITGRQFSEYVDPELGGYEYETLDVEVALHLSSLRGHKSFLVKPFEEKYELVMNAKGHAERWELLKFFSTDEVYAIADKLSVNRNGTENWMRTVNNIRILVGRKLDQLEQNAEVKKSVSVEVTEPAQVEVIDTPAIKAPKTQKGRKAMATIKELRATAKAYGLKGYSKLNKAQLEELIRKHESAVQAQQEASEPQEQQAQQEVNSETSAPAMIKFEVGKVYVSTMSSINIITNTTSTWISDAYLVLNRTARYITVKDVSPHLGTGEVKKFYVYNADKAGYVEYICQRKSSNPVYQNRIDAENVVDEAVVKEQMNSDVRAKVYPEEAILTLDQPADSPEATPAISTDTQTVSEPEPSTPETPQTQPPVIPSHDVAFDEPAYNPDVQEVTVIVDDIPADHEPDTREAGIAIYEAMEATYAEYIYAEDKYLTSHETDMTEKAKSDAAFRKYLTLLYEYRMCGTPKREEALDWVREFCSKSYWPEDGLPRKSIDVLETLCHKCGIHAADFKGYCSRHDMAVMLLREAGIETREKTNYEHDVELRKELQTELHKHWQKRHALRKVQRIFGEGSADAEALNGMWEQYQEEIDAMLYKYKAVALRLKNWHRYEAESKGLVMDIDPVLITSNGAEDALASVQYDVVFDECAYVPNYQENLAALDDVPESRTPNAQEVKTVAPAKFIIGRHYQSIGIDKGTVTFVGKISRDYGYFVDSINCYHKAKIKTDSTGEYASIFHKGGMYPAENIKANVELPEHEIISFANGTSVLLNAETIIHSYEELEAMLAPKCYQPFCKIDDTREMIAV